MHLGPLPKHADATAAKIIRILALVMTVGENADEAISEWRPVWLAFGIEFLAFLGPLGMVAAFRGGSEPEMQQDAISEKSKQPVNATTPAPETAAVIESAATPAKAKKLKKIKLAAVAGVGDVREWHTVKTTARPGNLLRVNECYAAYAEWCKERGLSGVSLTKFGMVMKGGLGVSYVERSKRGYYEGFALKGALKIVAPA